MLSLWKKVLGTGGARIYVIAVNIAVLIATARILGPEGRGLIAGVTTWVTLLATLGALSIGEVVVHRAAKARGELAVSKLFGSLIVIAFVLSAVTYVATGALLLSGLNLFGALPWWGVVAGLAVLPLAIWERYGAQLLVVSNNLSFVNRRLVWLSSIGAVILMTVLALGGRAYEALYVSLLTGVLVSIAGIGKLWRLADRRLIPDKSEIMSLLKDGLRLHLNAVGGLMLGTGSILMVNYFLSSTEVGIFQLALQMIVTMMIVPQAAGMVLNEHTARMGVDGVWSRQRRLILQLGLMAGCAVAALYFAAPLLIDVVAGTAFEASAQVFRILLLSVFGWGLSYIMANQWLGRGLFLQAGVLTLVFGVLNVIVGVVMIPRYGVEGAAWALSTVYLFAALTNVGMLAYVELKSRAADCYAG